MKKQSTGKAKMITGLAMFYRCNGADGYRYYPAPQSRTAAIDYNGRSIPPTVNGFGVYDTTVSTEYAVAIYPSAEEAEQHSAEPAPEAPKSIFHGEDEPAPEPSPPVFASLRSAAEKTPYTDHSDDDEDPDQAD